VTSAVFVDGVSTLGNFVSSVYTGVPKRRFIYIPAGSRIGTDIH